MYMPKVVNLIIVTFSLVDCMLMRNGPFT